MSDNDRLSYIKVQMHMLTWHGMSDDVRWLVAEVERLRTIVPTDSKRELQTQLEIERIAGDALLRQVEALTAEVERLRTQAGAEQKERDALWAQYNQQRLEISSLRQQLHAAQDIAARNIEERNAMQAQRDEALEQRDSARVEYVKLCKILGHKPADEACEQCEDWRPVDDVMSRA